MPTINNTIYEALDLDTIIENTIVESDKPMPDFTVNCEKSIATALLDYTKRVIKNCDSESGSNNTEAIVEKQADVLLDAICEANHIYIKNGMRLGAHLLLQLLIMN